jgi:predicted glycoside hydrolase/deacetylase ChbG (UPF0249 family)
MDKIKKKAIFVADDFGQTPGINRAIIESFNTGLIRSASLVVNGKFVEEAVKFAINNPKLETGLHLALVCEHPILPLTQISSIIDTDKKRFFGNRFILFWNILIGKAKRDEIEKELEAQILKFHSTGLFCSFLNSHDHVHLFPSIFPIVLKLCKKYKIPYLRIPDEKIKWSYYCLRSKEFRRSIFSYRNLIRIVLRMIYIIFDKKYPMGAVSKVDSFSGILYNCINSVESIKNIIASLSSGTTEIIFHPAYEDDEYRKLSTYRHMLNYKREQETKALCDITVKRFLSDNKVKLTKFRSELS